MFPEEDDPDEDDPEDTEPPPDEPDDPLPDPVRPAEPDRWLRSEEDEPEPEPEPFVLEVPAALLCEDPGSTAASTPDVAALAMPMPAVIAVIRRSPELRSADGEWDRRGGRSAMAGSLSVCGRRCLSARLTELTMPAGPQASLRPASESAMNRPAAR